jgi:LCP family protein required for cell wall assembly
MRHSAHRSTAVRHGRLPVRTARGPVARLIASVLVVAAISGGAVTAYAVEDTVSSLKPSIHLVSASGRSVAAPPTVGAESGAVNVLLAGTDTRTGQGGQFSTADELAGSSGAGSNDVTMVLHLSADHTHATVISIPRDLMVPVPACPTSDGSTPAQSSAQFNTTLSTGGLSCVVLTAEALTGLSIPYAAEITFDGVIAMSNAIGGVTVCLASPVTDPYVGLDLPAGQQTLVGEQALAFVRSRHGIGDGSDLGRISNQQLFLSALLRKATSAGTLGNPLTLYSLAKAASSNLQLSDTLASPTTLVSIALALKSVPLSRFVFLQYPAMTDPDDPNRVVPEPTGVAALKQALAADVPVVLTGTTGEGTVAATAAPVATPTSTPTPSSAASPSPAATPAPTPSGSGVSLPSDVTGQTADQQTCTKGG